MLQVAPSNTGVTRSRRAAWVSARLNGREAHLRAAVISAVTLLALALYPLPFCIDCEFPNPWGHADVWEEGTLSVWLLAAPLLAGLFALRRGWLVPVLVVFALLVTRPLGGVAWWSLKNNKGQSS